MRAAAQTDGAAAALQNIEERAKYGVGGQGAAGGLEPLSTESYGRTCSLSTVSYGRTGLQARQFLLRMAMAAVSSAVASSEVTMSAFRAGALQERL
jgi:hypothetical protein